jgi:hypothetical protein
MRGALVTKKGGFTTDELLALKQGVATQVNGANLRDDGTFERAHVYLPNEDVRFAYLDFWSKVPDVTVGLL